MIMVGILIHHANLILPQKDLPTNVVAHFQQDSHFQLKVALEDAVVRNHIVWMH